MDPLVLGGVYDFSSNGAHEKGGGEFSAGLTGNKAIIFSGIWRRFIQNIYMLVI